MGYRGTGLMEIQMETTKSGARKNMAVKKIKGYVLKLRKMSFFQYAYLIVFKIVSLLPKNKKLIVFESFLRKQYSCNPRAIYEYLKVTNSDYKMYWSIDPRYIENFQEHDIQYVKR